MTMRVFVYFNLHRKCWSIKALSSEGSIKRGRVFAHAKTVHLIDCTLKVSEAGRQRVLREKRKNVHAGIVGELIAYDFAYDFAPVNGVAVTYNPYKYETFVRRIDERPVRSAGEALLLDRAVYVGREAA
jgi:hypothetical protein